MTQPVKIEAKLARPCRASSGLFLGTLRARRPGSHHHSQACKSYQSPYPPTLRLGICAESGKAMKSMPSCLPHDSKHTP